MYKRQQSDTEQAAVEDTSLHVAVNYTFESAGDITAFSMDLKNFDGIGGVSYRAYTNTGGFLWWYHDGGLTGVPGDGNYVEAFQIQLTGDAERLYDVYYSATSTGQGKMGWAMNGQIAGTSDIGEKPVSYTHLFYYIDCFEDLEPGCFGIPEPKKSCMTAEETDAPVIVPGVAFSERFERTGYGAGYYDRFFEKEPQHRKIAICYDFQIAEAIAVDQYDVLMDQIITPGRELSRL